MRLRIQSEKPVIGEFPKELVIQSIACIVAVNRPKCMEAKIP